MQRPHKNPMVMGDLIDFGEETPPKDVSAFEGGTPLAAQLTILDEPIFAEDDFPIVEGDFSVTEVPPADSSHRDGGELAIERPDNPASAPNQHTCRQDLGDIWGSCVQKQWALHNLDRSQHQADSDQSQTMESRYLIIHDPELTKGVLDGVAKELSYTDSQVRVFGNENAQFLKIQAKSPEISAQRLEMARILTDEFISDHTVKTRVTFVEPSKCPLAGFEVFLDPETQESQGLGARPTIRPCDDESDAQFKDRIDEDPLYFGNFCLQLSAILKRVGRLNSGYNLKVAFGRYILTTYPKKRDTYDLVGFRKLMGQARCQGKLVSQLGCPNEGVRILNALKREDGIFQPPGVNTLKLDDMKPTFAFDVYSTQHKFTAQLVREGDEKVFTMKKLQCFPLQDEDSAELCYNTLCLGRGFDWKIQLMNEVQESDESYQSLKAYLATAQITLPQTPSGSNPDLTMFPHVKLGLQGSKGGNSMIHNIQRTSVSSIYSFRYGLTNYILDFVIRREWEKAREMTLRREPSLVTYSITLRGEHWGDYKGNRATDFSRAGRGWGAELEDLLPNDPGQNATTGSSRVEALVCMINHIHKILVAA
ncbi:hypothetical protein PG990_004737 [Apiospora arundinis]